MGRNVGRGAPNASGTRSRVAEAASESTNMTRIANPPPLTRRRFTSSWGELEYLCKKVHHWLHKRREKRRAERYRDRLERVLHDTPENDIAIIREEGLTLLSELKGHIGDSIRYRRREIGLMEALHRDAQSREYSASTRAYMLRDRGAGQLQERREILAGLVNEISRQNAGSVRRSG